MIWTRCHRERGATVSKRWFTIQMSGSHPDATWAARRHLSLGEEESSSGSSWGSARTWREAGGHTIFFSWALPTTAPGSQCVECCLNTILPDYVSSGLQRSQLASLCGQGQPFRTNGGQFTLSCSMATDFKKCKCAPSGVTTPCSYRAGGGNVLSPLFMRDPHYLCRQAPDQRCISFKPVISFQYHRFVLSHTPVWPWVTMTLSVLCWSHRVVSRLNERTCVKNVVNKGNVWTSLVRQGSVRIQGKAQFLRANRELVLK